MADVYLRDHPNPNLRQYRSPRREPLSGVFVLHSAENTPDFVAFDGGAEAVAGFISRRTDPGSYHFLSDSDSILPLVRWDDEAWHDATSGGNRHEVGGSVATRADVWDLAPKAWRDGALDNLARGFAAAARHVKATTGIVVPARLITREESERRVPGFLSHAKRDPERRTDPGFDGRPELWEQFLGRYTLHAADVLGTTPNPEEFTVDAAAKARFDKIDTRLASIESGMARKAFAVRGPDDRVWVCDADGRWHVPDMDTLDTLIFTGQVQGYGSKGITRVAEDFLDGYPIDRSK